MLKLLLLPTVVSFVIAAFFYVLVEQSIMDWLPTFNYEVLHIPSSFSIILASIMAASTAAGRLCGGIVLKRFFWFHVLITCLILTAALILIALPLAKAAGFHTITEWKDIPVAGYIIPMVGFFLAPIYPVINSVILGSLPKSQHGSMAGLIMVFSAIGGSFGAVITGFIFQHYGGQTAFYFSIIPIALLITVLIIFKKKIGDKNALTAI